VPQISIERSAARSSNTINQFLGLTGSIDAAMMLAQSDFVDFRKERRANSRPDPVFK
jgi:hypothetical protein